LQIALSEGCSVLRFQIASRDAGWRPECRRGGRYARSKKQILRSARHSSRLPTYQVMKIKLVIFGVFLVATLVLAGCSDRRRGYEGYGYPSYWGYGGYDEGEFVGERFRGFHGDRFHGGEFHDHEFHGGGFHGDGFRGGGFHGGGHR
jgi:hypothetical protein